MDDTKTPPRFTVIVDQDMFDAIEEFRFTKRFQTRKDAINALIQLGLDAIEKEQNKKGESNGESRSLLP